MVGIHWGSGSWKAVLWSLTAIATSSTAVLILCATAIAAPQRFELLEMFGPDGTESGQFTPYGAGPVAIDHSNDLLYAADAKAGKIYKFDLTGTPVNWGGSAGNVSGNELSGLAFTPEAERQIAVDPASGAVYATSGNSVRVFQSNGESGEFTAGPYMGSGAIEGFTRLAGIAVDGNGFIYASDLSEDLVKVFAPSGEQVNQFTADEPANLAVDASGAVYVTRYLNTVHKFTPSSFPVTPGTSYAAGSSPFEQKQSYSVAVDPSVNDVYISRTSAGVAKYDESGGLVAAFGGPGSEGELTLADGIAVDSGNENVYVGNTTSGGGSSQVYVFRPEPPQAPRVEHLAAGRVSSSTATLNALINPGLRPTVYHFEYGLEDCSVIVCSSLPQNPASVGDGNEGVWVARAVGGLQPGTEYHFLVKSENDLGSVEEAGTFKTQGSGLTFQVGDSRVWEMVSPPNKRGARLIGSGSTGSHLQASADGDGLIYASIGSIENAPDGSRALEPSSVLARRDAAGSWHSEDITPANSKVAPTLTGSQGEFKLFSPDLSKAVLDPRSKTELSLEASERGPYLRENSDPPAYRPLVTGREGFANVPPGTEFGGGTALISAVTIQTANRDLSHVVVRSAVPLVEGAPGGSVYRWTNGLLEPIGVLPDAEGGGIVAGEAGSAGVSGSLRHAISEDGSRIFWTGPNPTTMLQPNQLYLRDVAAGVSARIDVVQPGASGAGTEQPVFQGASPDGTVVFFTDSQQLTGDASPAGSDLYRCEIASAETGCTSLVNLTPPLEGSGESAEVQGIVSGLSDDGSRAYFVAKGVLTAEVNQFGHAAVAGEPNLYLWEREVGLRYIVTLTTEDRSDWGRPAAAVPPGQVSLLSTAISPTGRYFAFMSERQLTNSENVDGLNLDVATGEAVERVFLFDAVADRLQCVSCAPTGAAPEGTKINDRNVLIDPRNQWQGRQVAAMLPQPVTINQGGNTIYQPRAVLDSGRMFFNAIDSLVPGDSNRQWDVYQYEDVGHGGCSSESENAAVVRSGEGCISLISSGTGDAEVGFLDASVSGDDVFFLTPARLARTDVDNEVDVYDARVNGIDVAPPSLAECVGEQCRPSSSEPPDASPSSAFFNGRGNVTPRRSCPKGKRKAKRGGKHRCIKVNNRGSHRRSGHKGGVGR